MVSSLGLACDSSDAYFVGVYRGLEGGLKLPLQVECIPRLVYRGHQIALAADHGS